MNIKNILQKLLYKKENTEHQEEEVSRQLLKEVPLSKPSKEDWQNFDQRLQLRIEEISQERQKPKSNMENIPLKLAQRFKSS
jgi:hypothetical protein